MGVHVLLRNLSLFCTHRNIKQPLISDSLSSPCIHPNRLCSTFSSNPSSLHLLGVHSQASTSGAFVSGYNFKRPCAQNKCRHSAILKNRKSLNGCYRNFFCVLVVKFRAVLNIYWASVAIPEWSFSTSNPQFP